MTDNSVYWTPEPSNNWYQHQPGPPLPQTQPPPPQYPSGPYPASAISNDHSQLTPPPSQQQTPQPTPPQTHHQINHYHHHQQQQQQQQPPPPPPPQVQQQHQQQIHHQHHQNHNNNHHIHQMMPNGLSNGAHNMQNSSIACGQTVAQAQAHTHPSPRPTMNHYNPHMNNSMHHETLASAPMQSTQIDPSSNYQMHQPLPPTQIPPPPQQQPQQPAYQPPPPPHNPMYQSNSYPPNMAQNVPNSMHPAMQQASHQQPQYSQRYSPPTYWNSAPMHNQSNYGPPPPNGVPASVQNVTTPPATIPDSTVGYHTTTAQASLPPPPPQQQQQQPSHPPPQNMPYDGRGTTVPPTYNAPYQQSAPGYYSPHEAQPPPPDPGLSYDMSHQQPPDPQLNWSNGYYQQNQPSYAPNIMNSYQAPTYNGSNTVPTPPGVQPAPVQGLPNHPPHYPMHQPPQQTQQWGHHNQAKPIGNTKQSVEKKPVKPRAPKKQSNPDAPSGRRKRPVMTEEHKKSGYSKYYSEKRKDYPHLDFGELSSAISDSWNNLSEEEKSCYAKAVSKKRREMLKKKASQQAQNLLIQGIKEETIVPSMQLEKI